MYEGLLPVRTTREWTGYFFDEGSPRDFLSHILASKPPLFDWVTHVGPL